MWGLLLLLLSSPLPQVQCEPNPPTWPSSVYVADPSNSGATQTALNNAFGNTGEFSNNRYAFLFRPGTHNVNASVNYYMSILGLGKTPTDTTITSFRCQNGGSSALVNFWRSVENIATRANTLWAVSQAAPLRRVSITGNLDLSQNGGYSSGGYLGDSVVTGTITSGTQQQWFTRNTKLGSWNGGNWNMVFVGSAGNPPTHCGTSGGGPYTTVAQTPVIAEKPYIYIDTTGKYFLRVPRLETNKVGPTTNYDNADDVDFANVYVATAAADTATTINNKLAAGEHVVLSPGVYRLTDSISITKPNTVVIGIGFPTLVATNGRPTITIANVDGVKIGGILFQAGETNTSALVRWGTTGYNGNASNPGFFYDAFARVGGPTNSNTDQVTADIMVQINSGNVIVDNSWFWRADHDIQGEVTNSHNPSYHGFEVNGPDVTVYGLASEHLLHDLVNWNGENGRTYFYQSEFPYDVTQANFGTPGYVAYRVNSSVAAHHAWGVGAYSYFRDNVVTAVNGIGSGTGSNVVFVNSFTRYLSGNGGIAHVINGRGNAVNSSHALEYVC